MKPSLCRLLLVAALSMAAGTLPAKTLNILLLANASTQNVIQKLIREYQQQNPDTDFNVSIVQSNSITAKLNTLVTAGQPPDIVEITTAFIQNYAAQALDLGKYTNTRNFSNVICPAIAHSLPLGTRSSACRSKPRQTGFSTTKNSSRRHKFKFHETRTRSGPGTNSNKLSQP
jgi:Bacterial extracellular solute-binding protein